MFLQGYWLYNTYRLSGQQFEKEVSDVVRRLEYGYAVADIERLGLFTDSMGRRDTARLTRIVDLLLSGPQPAPLHDTDTLRGRRRLITDSQMKIAIFDERTTTFRKPVRDTLNFRIDTRNSYTKEEFTRLSHSVQSGIDSLLHRAGIGSAYAFTLSNINGAKATYFPDEDTFKRLSGKTSWDAKMGVERPYRMTLAVGNGIVYILRNMAWVLLSSIAIVGMTAWAYVMMLRTIFQQKRLSDVKTDFINNMTHEFKTPIATVSLAVEALEHFDVMKKPEQAREYLDICRNELNRISVMVERVLKMAAFEKLDFTLTLQKTDIGKLLADIVENMRPQWEQRNATITVQSSGSVAAKIDRTHLANVIYNLIDNSLKYADRVPEIEISYRPIGVDRLRLTVCDNGIGIPTAYQSQVFDNFFRVPTGNIHNAKGFGLGLSYVATVVKKHHGQISLDSAVGKGSTFTIDLPINGPQN